RWRCGRSLLGDRQALLRARRRLAARRQVLAERRDVASDLLDARGQDLEIAPAPGPLGGPLDAAAEPGHRALDALEPGVHPVVGVLDPLEPLRDRPQAAGEALDVGGGWNPEGAHRRLL